MKKALVVLTIAGAMIAGTGSAFAGNIYNLLIQHRIGNEKWRIDQGIASGELTAREAARVQISLDSIMAQEAGEMDGM